MACVSGKNLQQLCSHGSAHFQRTEPWQPLFPGANPWLQHSWTFTRYFVIHNIKMLRITSYIHKHIHIIIYTVQCSIALHASSHYFAASVWALLYHIMQNNFHSVSVPFLLQSVKNSWTLFLLSKHKEKLQI